MTINICVNGTFRYPAYVRHYAAAGMLGRFYYSHRRSTVPEGIGLNHAAGRNLWLKQYALQAAARGLPARVSKRVEAPVCDWWQRGVVRDWHDCDAVEAVIGAVADRILAFAKGRGCRTLGHPVCAHPDKVAALVGRAFDDVGLDPLMALPAAGERRRTEIELCDRLLVDSGVVAHSFTEAGVPAERISVVPPGADLERFRPRGPDDCDRDVFRVVCVGTITPRKGQHVLLRAWRLLRLPRAELVLVGPRGAGASAVTRGFEGSFTHLARVPNAALRALLVRASVFVLPSVEDGFAQAPVEAMSCGVPVIVTANNGTAEMVTDGHDGFVIPAFDAEALAARLEALYRQRDLARGMGEAAAVTAARQGSWETYVDRVLAVHRSVAGRAGSSHREAA